MINEQNLYQAFEDVVEPAEHMTAEEYRDIEETLEECGVIDELELDNAQRMVEWCLYLRESFRFNRWLWLEHNISADQLDDERLVELGDTWNALGLES